MARKKFRPAWWAVIVVALLSALMIALGVWQLQRGFAKQKLLDRYQQASSVAPVPLSAGHVAREDEIERAVARGHFDNRSEEHTSELQSLMRNSYAVFFL